MKLFILFADVFALAALSWAWYQGDMLPAWVPLIWCAAASFQDLEKYLESK